MANEINNTTEDKLLGMTDKEFDKSLDNFFESDTFKELIAGWEARDAAITEELNKLTNEDILYFAHKALDKGVAVLRDESEEENYTKSDALYSYVSQKVKHFFNLDELYSGKMFKRTVNIPFNEFVDPDIEFGDELMFVEWFVPLEIEGQTLILQAIYGQGEAFFTFETLAHSHKHVNENAWKGITKTYPIQDLFPDA